MHFAFDDDQLAFRDAVRDLLAKECPTGAVRAAWTNETGRTESAWSALAGMGVIGALAPEAAGGLGLTALDTVLLFEEAGRAALPEPVTETVAVAVPVLAALDDPGLGLLLDGASAAAVCPEAPLAVWADTASLVVTLAADGVRVAPVEAVELTPAASVDGTRRLFAVELAGVAPSGDVRAAAAGFFGGALATAAQLLGLADRMIEMTVDYAKQRKQFGVAIGSFQAVKHHLASARVALEFARPLVYRAAYSLAHDDPDRATDVSMAKQYASDAALVAARAALQCHGAIGYTTEYDLHLYMKRAWALAASWGDSAWHRDRVARAIL